MKRETMLHRLKKGDNPIKISLDKWKKLKPPFSRDRFHKVGVNSTCGLCAAHPGCYACPLLGNLKNIFSNCDHSCHPWRGLYEAVCVNNTKDQIESYNELVTVLELLWLNAKDDCATAKYDSGGGSIHNVELRDAKQLM